MKNNRDSRLALHSVGRPYLYLGTVAMPDLAEFLQGFNFGETNVCPTFTLLLSFIGCGDAICCWPLDLSESSKAGRPWASSWSKLFRHAVQFRFKVSTYPSW